MRTRATGIIDSDAQPASPGLCASRRPRRGHAPFNLHRRAPAHGYAYTSNSLFEPLEWVYTTSNARPNVVGRQPYGLTTIANSDAGASPHTDTAFWEAHRAVGEVLNRRAMPIITNPTAAASRRD